MTEYVSLAIVGAGPAGLEAAITAAKAGVPVTLIDSQPQPGGQYFKQLPEAFSYKANDTAGNAGSSGGNEEAQVARTLLEQLELGHIRLLTNTLVWGAFPTDDDQGWLLTLRGPEAPHRLQAKLLILATGAYDRPIPCPGWTLPGVMTAGGLQTLLKHQHVLPGQRFVLSGTGPLQLAVAAQLIQAGADVAAVLEASPKTGWRGLRHAAGMWGQWQRLREGWDHLRLLRQANVAYRTGWAVVAAYGEQEVEEVVLAQLDDDWFPISGTEETISADSLVLGYGFIPSTELTRLLGCRHDFKPEQGGYVPQRDAQMQTSQPGVYAVGDGAGVGGVGLARIEGRIAGLAAAQQLGWLKEAAARTEMARHQSELKGERRFAGILGELFTPGPGLYSLAQAETIICRCEEVSFSTLREAIAAGAWTVNEVKGLTRAGMGNCQGRICGELVARIIAQTRLSDSLNAYANSISEAGVFTARPPIHPLPLSDLAEAASDELSNE